nr:uncharacterized protein LOC127317474 isoform X2 [Lolium perenne]
MTLAFLRRPRRYEGMMGGSMVLHNQGLQRGCFKMSDLAAQALLEDFLGSCIDICRFTNYRNTLSSGSMVLHNQGLQRGCFKMRHQLSSGRCR